MSDAKHTSGPWTFENHSPAVPLLGIYAPDNKSPWHADRSDEEKSANARLAAASPELYEALIALYDYVGDPIGFAGSADSVFEKASAALAKATGAAND